MGKIGFEKEKGMTFRPIKDNRFRFRCHKGIECFTRCCRDLNLILGPYDIIRLKNRLDIPSDTFLEEYTETRLDERSRFPMLYLKMGKDSEKRCPFVSSNGCTVYEDRPNACRIYPLGRAALKPDGRDEPLERFFIVTEDHCLGFDEDREWTIESWMQNEGVNEYNAINDLWMEIITSTNSLGQGKDLTRKIQMFYMASYNLDKFREFLFKSTFFQFFKVEEDLKRRISTEDVALMRFALDWLKFSLFGEKTIQIDSRNMNRATNP